MSELESHYDRLCRTGIGFYWKRFFLGVAILIAGGMVGAVYAGPGWTTLVKCSAVIVFVCLLAWRAIDETESEDIRAIREDFKKNILDSIELVQVEEGETAKRTAVAS